MEPSAQPDELGLLGYLCVDRFLKNPITVAALHYCASRGWIEKWNRDGRIQFHDPVPNTQVLVAMLIDAGVAVEENGITTLANSFKQAWKYSDLMMTKLDFCRGIISDVGSFDLWMEDPTGFQKNSKLFRLFDYGKCIELTPQNIQATSRWVKLTTALSRYEAPLFVKSLPWASHRRWLDLGGNSGEFAMQMCKRFKQLRATVLDLPVVCYLGQKHVESFGMSDRVVFESGDFLHAANQPRFDLVSFKSVLHDWPPEHAVELIERAWDRLLPGGRLLIIERTKIPRMILPVGLGQAPVWMFWNHYRAPDFYESILDRYHRVSVDTQIMDVDMPWMVLQSIKPPSSGIPIQ